MIGIRRYGMVPLDRVDVRGMCVAVIDLRKETGLFGVPNETHVVPPGHPYTLSVFAPLPGEPPVAEIRIWMLHREASIVGHLTGRPGVFELTPDHLMAAADPATPEGYITQIRQYLGVI